MEVTNKIQIYEKNRKNVYSENRFLHIESYWNGNSRVIIEIDGDRYTVLANELRMAVQNAVNKK